MRRCAAMMCVLALAAAGCESEVVPPDAVAGSPASAASPTASAETSPTTPTAPPKPPVVEKGWCSDELVAYMVDQSTSTEFKRGFGRPVLLEGLDVGCTAIARTVSFAGYLDTFAFVRRKKDIDDLLGQRILALGYTRDTLAPGVFMNAAGDPEGFIRILGEGGDRGGKKFEDHKQWVVIQFYLPG